MSIFRRRRSADRSPAPEPTAAEPTGDDAAAADPSGAEASEEATRGPWDLEQRPDLDGRVDVGGLRIPARKGMQVRMELEPKSRRIVSVNIALEGSALQLQAFAAPRGEGLWDDLRPEIVESITKQGGTVEARQGTFGEELLARLPVRAKDGRTGHRPARFLGVDGSRWFLRGVITGPAALEASAGEALEAVFADVVVVRGGAPRAPRDLLPLHLPGKPGEAVAPAPARPVLDPDQGRGPEITEVG